MPAFASAGTRVPLTILSRKLSGRRPCCITTRVSAKRQDAARHEERAGTPAAESAPARGV